MPEDTELPENVAMLKVNSRRWNGVTVDVVEYTCTGRVLIPLQRNEALTRLGGPLEEVGRGHAEARAARNTPNPHAYKPRSLYLAPANMPLWGHTGDSRYVKCGSVSFDTQGLEQRLGISASPGTFDAPRLRLQDDRLWALVKLLADAIDEEAPGVQLYGDSLAAAIIARLFEPPRETKSTTSGLTDLQLKDAIGYLEAKMPAKVDLATLAQLAGLSQSHYSRAFKASTGLAPYQWQLRARVERAQDLLLNTTGGLDDIAEATGFADAVHFGRTFRKLTGATPAAWRMDRLT